VKLQRVGVAIGSFCRGARIVAFALLDSVVQIRRVPKRDVAVVIRLDAIGDFFIWMQSGAVDVSNYARRNAGKAILVASSTWAEYARSSGLWDEVISVKPLSLMRRPLYRLRFMWQVRGLGARLLIQPRAARVFLQEDCIARIVSTAHRVGNAGTYINTTPGLLSFGNRFYDRLIDVNRTRDKHEITRNQEFVLALTGREATQFEFRGASTERADEAIVVVLGAGQSGRIWPLDRLAHLVAHIRAEYPRFRIVLLGTNADRRSAEGLTNLAPAAIENRVGSTELRDYVAAIAAAALVICNDTSAYHIAMALRRPVLCFLGGGHFGWFAPYPASYSNNAIVLRNEMECYWCNWHCRYPRADGGAFRCVASITVDAAERSISRLIGDSDA
jgi:ADP-heptose:LPS heptosyltransferase